MSAAGGPADTGSTGSPLPLGHRVHEFLIERVIGEGGFGIVYLVRDEQLQRTVALKEYMPAALAARQADLGVSVRSERHRETFDLGLRSFVNEARLLASFDHPSLVKVYRFWEQNGTAFMVMPYYEGPTLKAWLKTQPAPPSEAWLKELLRPLLDALELIHADRCFHRDIAPDNILLLGPRQQPVLLDFGAARRVIGDATQALTTILKPGYAPIEQYAEVPSMKQGAWTDVYALCAVLYAAITGRPPTPAVARIVKDEWMPLSQCAAGRYSPAFLSAVDAGLALLPQDRLPDIGALRQRLFAAQPQGAADDERTVLQVVDDLATVIAPVRARAPRAAPEAPAMAAPAPTAAAPQPSVRAASSGSHKPLVWVGGGVAGLALAAVLVWFVTREGAEPPVAVVAPAPQAPTAAPAQPPPAVEAPARPPFSVVGALEDIVRHADPLIAVNTLAGKDRLVIGRDRMQFRVKSSEAGHLYVFLAGTDRSHFWLLFPNTIDRDNRIAADTEMTLPRRGWQITAGGPPGVNHVVTMVSREPRDFVTAGLQVGESIPEFDLATAQRLWAGSGATSSTPFAGDVRCAGGQACDAGYGAALIRIEEIDAPR